MYVHLFTHITNVSKFTLHPLVKALSHIAATSLLMLLREVIYFYCKNVIELTMCGKRTGIVTFVKGGAYSNYRPTLQSFDHSAQLTDTVAYFWTLSMV